MSTRPWAGGMIAPGVTCVVAPNPGPMTFDGTNTYLVETAAGVVVVDPGPDDATHLDAVLAALAPRPCVGVLLTHGHADHTGMLDALLERTESWLLAPDQVPPELQRHETPGHTSDSVTYVVTAARLALTGDTVLGRGPSVVAWPDGSLASYLRSLDALHLLAREGEIGLIGPGHGPVVPALATLNTYLTHREQRLHAVRVAASALLAQDPGLADTLPRRPAEVRPGRDEGDVLPEEPGRPRDLADAIVDEVYADTPQELRRAARVSVLAQLDYLGHLPG